jgi:uncharacterized membrane protein YdbT with pleckstrin-like domain
VLFLIFAVFAADYMSANIILVRLQWIPWLVSAIFLFSVWLNYFTSEFAVTSRRVMMREGFFIRHANEMRLNTISQVNIDQSIIGQMLNYGNVTLNAFGVSDSFTTLADPGTFQKMVNEQLDNVVSGK